MATTNKRTKLRQAKQDLTAYVQHRSSIVKLLRKLEQDWRCIDLEGTDVLVFKIGDCEYKTAFWTPMGERHRRLMRDGNGRVVVVDSDKKKIRLLF